MTQPITPTRVIPAGQPIPTAPPMPTAPPGATNLPPWRVAATPPSPPPQPPPPPVAQRTVYVAVPPPPPMPVHVHVTIADAAAEPEPETRRSWQWLIDWARPWHSLTAAVAVLLPIPSYGGYSLTSAWSTVLQDARTDGLTTAYVLAIVATGGAFLLDKARPAWWTRALLIITVIGGTGALGWYDPVTLLTGVHP